MAGLFILELLLAALGIAVNPPAVIASIVLASASRRRALAFAAGWTVGLLAVGSILMLVGDAAQPSGGTSLPVLVAKVMVGLVLLWLSGAKWRSYRTSAVDKELPGWMKRLHEVSAPRAFMAAAAYASLNPKTIAFNAAGVLTILGASLGVRWEWTALAVFVLLAGMTVTVPVAAAVLAPRRSTRVLALANRWLGQNSSAVAAAVLLVLGLMVLYSGAEGLVPLFRFASGA